MIRLRLLGPLTLKRSDGSTVRSVPVQPKRFALLAYLAATHPPAPRRRDTLLGLFWPETDEERARTSLRQSLYQLRRSLGAVALTSEGSERVGVNPDRVWCDAAAFGAALAEGRPDEALQLYRGPFLEGFHLSGAPEFGRWVERERRRIQLRAVEAAWDLAETVKEEGDRARTQKRAERALQLDPYDEYGLRRYMLLMDELGQPAAAVRAYESYAARLAADLSLEPSAETTALVRAIGDGKASSADSSGRDPSSATDPSPGEYGPSSTPDDAQGDAEPTDEHSGTAPAVPSGASRTGRAGGDGGPTLFSRKRRRLAMFGALLGIVLLAAVGLAAFVVNGDSGGEDSRIRSLAVLPLDNLSGDPEQAYFTDGMTEALIAELGRIQALDKVTPRTSVMRYRESEKALSEIAQELDVDALVEGSVLRAGDGGPHHATARPRAQ